MRISDWSSDVCSSDLFCYFDYPIKDLAGSTLGIVGEGALGQSVASIGRALGMRVTFAARKGGAKQGSLYTPFEQMLAQSDVITLHCPLNDPIGRASCRERVCQYV